MKKFSLLVVAAVMLLSLAACQSADVAAEPSESIPALTVAVGIVPEAAFVQAVGGDLVSVVAMVPPGSSPANYQPTAAEMQALSDASIYFTLQMPTEKANILPKLTDFNPSIQIVDLQKATAEVYPLLNGAGEEVGIESIETADHHLWLSPKRAMVMVQTIADQLSAVDAGNKDAYQANAASYIAQLKDLDAEIQDAVSKLANKSFLIYHAAYGYFAHDYALTMVSLENEGKPATAESLQAVIDYAKQNQITTVFYQQEFDDSQAATVAEEIGGVVQKVAPLSIDYIQGLKDFVSALSNAGE